MAIYIGKDVKAVYTLGRELGKGSYGTVFLCTEKATGVEYACKCISKFKCILENKIEDVRREIEIMCHLAGHPNIVAIKGIYEDVTMVYLVMELCKGGELFQRIVKRGSYPEAKARQLMRTIVSTVESCHLLGVIHRDLKPENFLFQTMDEDSALKCSDFGLSKFFEPNEILTEKVGSPTCVAPEVLDGEYGPEADMWSIGVIMFVLLSGAWPFWANSVKEMVNIIKKREPPNYVEDTWSNISDGAKDLVQKLLNPNPQQRLKAFEVMRHPWIWEDSIGPNKLITSLVQ